MPTERERIEIKKALAFDLFLALEANPEKTQYTRKEIRELFAAHQPCPGPQKEDREMPSEQASIESKKAMAYDLLNLLKEARDKTYTYDELEALIDAYITGLSQ